MGLELYFTVGLAATLAIWWWIEYARHMRFVEKIKIRIHVNGTRGKSSLTRLIAAVFREAGYRTIAKTTGTHPYLIFPDGTEEFIRRRGSANIREQFKFVELAGKMDVDVMVGECMALQPFYVRILETRVMHATSAVITNTHPDHLDVMGPTNTDVVDALSGMIPENGTLFTSEHNQLERIRRNATTLGATVYHAGKEQVTNDEMGNFDYIEHKDNVALALEVAKHHGIERETALRGMWKATPDSGALRVYHIERNGRNIYFANAFAANDPHSTSVVWEMVQERHPVRHRYIVINNRADRQTRTQQIAASIKALPAERYFLVGGATDILRQLMIKNGFDKSKIEDLSSKRPDVIVERIVELSGGDSVCVGIGNIGGAGHGVVDVFGKG